MSRIRTEFRNPTKFASILIMNSILRLRKLVLAKPRAETGDQLYGIYDLAICDITYNFGIFLAALEFEAKARKKKGYVVVLVPPFAQGSKNSHWGEYNSKISDESISWRFDNLLLPLISLSPYCTGYYLLPNRSDVVGVISNRDIYPDLYDGTNLRKVDLNIFLFETLTEPNQITGLRAPRQGITYVENWLKFKKIDRPIVSVTLRNSPFDPARNSNLKEWSKFVSFLKSQGYCPIVIPDTDDSFNNTHPFSDSDYFRECAWNLGLRISLYEVASFNFFGNNGCVVLGMFNPRVRYILTNGLPKNSLSVNKEVLSRSGMGTPERYRFSTSGQHLDYEEDNFENLKLLFFKYVKPEQNKTIVN